MPHPFGKSVSHHDRLREILPLPAADAISMVKVVDHIDAHIRRFIAHCPYAVIATTNRAGQCDASPRGGEAGFIHVLDDKHLLIPEASGNRRADTLGNLLDNPQIGMLLLVPGYEETLRLNGRATITEDAALLRAAGPVKGRLPVLGIGIEVQECFLHCAKAAMRSSLWNPMGWPDLGGFPTAAEIFQGHTASKIGDGSLKDIQLLLNESYTHRL